MLKTPKGLSKNKAGARKDKPALGNNAKRNSNILNKWQRVLAAFLTKRSYNRFEAERLLHDHCLHSTVSFFENSKGIVIDREWETVKGFGGSPTQVKRYWINPDRKNIKRARNIIKRAKGGAL